MQVRRQHNDHGQSNGAITLRPHIFFPGKPGQFDKIIGVTHFVEFTAAYMTPGTLEYAEWQKGTTKVDRERLRAMRLLRYVHAEGDKLAARKALADAAEILLMDTAPIIKSMFVSAKEPRKAAAIYAQYLTDEMRGARLMVHRGTFVPVIRCRDMKTAMFVFGAFRGVETCLNCHKLFAVDAARPDGSATSEKYCTAACGQRYRQKMYRRRHPAKARPKKSSKRNG